MVCRCTGAVQDEVVTRPECDSVNSDFKCCNATAPCGLGEGDCDKDADCAGDLVCGTDNCAAGSSKMDCCEGALRVTHTKFFEADRSLSAFGMRCRPDGNFDFVNMSVIIESSATNRTKSDSNILIYNRVPKCASTTMLALLSRLKIWNNFTVETSNIYWKK